MTIYTKYEYGTSLLETQSAPLTEGWSVGAEAAGSFIGSIMGQRELARAKKNLPPNWLDTKLWGEPDPAASESPTLPADEARKRLKDAGIKMEVPDSGMRENAIDVIIDHHMTDLKRQSVLDRMPNTLAGYSVPVAASLIYSLTDPLNVAAGLVPIVGEARYAALVARSSGFLGRTATRYALGSLEGAVGSAALEPINAAEAYSFGDDYTIYDTLANIAFGSVLGGGLHAGIGIGRDVFLGAPRARSRPAPGSVPDIMSDADLPTREAALKAGVAQAVTGRGVDVQDIVALQAQRKRDFAIDELTAHAQERPEARADIDAMLAEGMPPERVADIVAGREARPAPRPAGEPVAAVAEPPIPKGKMRFYHGAYDDPTTGGARFVTPDRQYARDYQGGNRDVHSVDLTPEEAEAQGLLDPEGRPQNGQLSEELSKRLKPAVLTAPAPALEPLPRVQFDPNEAPFIVKPIEDARNVSDAAGLTDDIHRLTAEGKDVEQIRNALIGQKRFPENLQRATDQRNFVRNVQESFGAPAENAPEFPGWQRAAQRRYAGRTARDTLRPVQDIKGIAESAYGPQTQTLADFEALRAADEKMKAAPKPDQEAKETLEKALDEVKQTARDLDADPENITALASVEEALAMAKVARKGPPKGRFPANPENKMEARPVLRMLRKAGGVRTGSPLAQELGRMDINARTQPGLFKKRGGLSSADQFPRSENPLFAQPSEELALNDYISEAEILSAIRDEMFGNPRRTPEEIAAIEDWKAEVERMYVGREEGPQREFAPIESYADLADRFMSQYDDYDDVAGAYGRAVEAAAECRIRNGE